MLIRQAIVAFLFILPVTLRADTLPVVKDVELQPLSAQVKRVLDALDYLGSPLAESERKAIEDAKKNEDKKGAVVAIQEILDRHCLAAVKVERADKFAGTKTMVGPAKPELAQHGWRVFLIKVLNKSEFRTELRPESPNAAPLQRRSSNVPAPTVEPVSAVENRFLDLAMHNTQPLLPRLSGLEVEYRVLQIYCRDASRKEARLGFSQWEDGKKNIYINKGNSQATIIFDSSPAVIVKLQVKDDDGKPAKMAAFVFRDEKGRVYPAMSRRLAPDFFFHAQIYRGDGESVLLQPGKYTVSWTRGPEYLVQSRQITVPKAATHTESFELKRWIHLAKKGWWSGDHHIHAAGCAHYESPTEGVTPEDMMRHVLGEDLNVGCCLSWGPCWYHQKRYFSGDVHPLSTPEYVLRYDVEVSGFPSSHAGHICLLRLKKQDYPGTKLIGDWPSWDLPIFKWAKEQGGVVGFAHSGWGLSLGATRELPTDTIPPFDSIGANEYIVDVTHDACDFISTVDTPPVWELNIWYHTLNCGYRCRISGETDFPCIFGERVGIGRSYVHLNGKLDFNAWVEGIKNGRCYVCDGKSHLIDFKVEDTAVGTGKSEVHLKKPGKVRVKASAAALLEPKPTALTEQIRNARLDQKPYWDIERARIGGSRKVPVEVLVNGKPVAQKEIVADGTVQEVSFDVDIDRSSWVALRVFPSSHTNPIFVLVDGKPIRASKKSAEWCLRSVDQCWKQKKRAMRPNELKEAEEAYEHARREYRKILQESVGE
jgi:hypothetical protein